MKPGFDELALRHYIEDGGSLPGSPGPVPAGLMSTGVYRGGGMVGAPDFDDEEDDEEYDDEDDDESGSDEDGSGDD